MAGGAFEDLRADRGVRPRVADDARLDGGEPARFIASGDVFERHGMTLRMNPHRLLTAERQLDRLAGESREERGLRLNGHVFLSAERAAARYLLDQDLVRRTPRNESDLPAVVEDPLPAAVDAEPAVSEGFRDGALGLEKKMFDALRAPGAANDVSTGGERRVDVASHDRRAREEIRMIGMDARRVVAQRFIRSRTGGRTSYVTSINAAASRAVASSVAATAAITSPT